MVVFEIGRVCIKTAGREAGKYCVVVKKEENKSFVLVTGPKLLTGVKRRRCNIAHLKPTEHKLDIKEDAKDEEVIEAYEVAGLIKKLKLKKPSVVEMKVETAKEGKGEKKEEKPKKEKS